MYTKEPERTQPRPLDGKLGTPDGDAVVGAAVVGAAVVGELVGVVVAAVVVVTVASVEEERLLRGC